MKPRLLSTLTLITTLALITPARAENLQQTQQLLSTRQCQNCDLNRVGLVYADLSGANLNGASLIEANLTQANLTGASLQGADLRGAVLYNINLTGTNLSGANLAGADLRDANLLGANLQGANLTGTDLMGAVNIPNGTLVAEDYYRWGLTSDQHGDFSGAIRYYTQALSMKPDFAHAYLARSASLLQLRNIDGALTDAQKAQQLYVAEGNAQGNQVSTQFIDGIHSAQEAADRPRRRGGGNFLSFLGGLASMAVQFLPMLLIP
jgi:tetratricopeptide (TPR) repeat protein